MENNHPEPEGKARGGGLFIFHNLVADMVLYNTLFMVRDTKQETWPPTPTDTLLSSTVATQPSASNSTISHS